MAASGELGHDAFRLHAAGEHMAVVAIGGDELVALSPRHLHADDDRLLADIKVAEAADQPHAVELSRLLLEAADEQHVAIGLELLIGAEERGALGLRLGPLLVVEPKVRGAGREAGRGAIAVLGGGHLGPPSVRDQPKR